MRNEEARIYELVMPEEFRQLRSRNAKHHELYRAIRSMKNLPAGQGIKIRCPGTQKEAVKIRKAAVQIARREGIPARTMLRGGWLFIEKLKGV
ncbi:MAG TPA: hypothetical protein VKW06_01695 [Candidatus Angelobacter sp.]|nr:hypothetical protein [Candidatus Angelobacter sp.]